MSLIRTFIIFIIIIAITTPARCQTIVASPNKILPPQPVESVDLNRYSGLWYEIAHLPNKLQEGCQDSTATFALRADSEIDVLINCSDKQDGSLHHAKGRGWAVDKSRPARLKFSFLWPFRSEYVILDQGKEYEYSVICTIDRKRLWIIARSPVINNDLFENILRHIEKQGFNRESLIKTDHAKHSLSPMLHFLPDDQSKASREIKN